MKAVVAAFNQEGREVPSRAFFCDLTLREGLFPALVCKPRQVVIETMNGPMTGDTAEEGVTSDIFRDRQPGMINHPHRDN